MIIDTQYTRVMNDTLNTMNMKISFVIPAYNEEHLLPLCLSSLERELADTICDGEVIVVNNASKDNTRKVAREHSCKCIVVDEERKGLVWARAAGFHASDGDIIAHIDADTILPQGWLKKVLHEFDKDPKLAALSGPFIYYDITTFERFLVHVFYSFGLAVHLMSQYIFHSGAMLQGGNFIVRRSLFEKMGGFDTSITFYGEDTDIARRISKVGKVKWTFGLPIYSSGRRFGSEGIVLTGLRYALNFVVVLIKGKPKTFLYNDIR